jgi:hypothetical protein
MDSLFLKTMPLAFDEDKIFNFELLSCESNIFSFKFSLIVSSPIGSLLAINFYWRSDLFSNESLLSYGPSEIANS